MRRIIKALFITFLILIIVVGLLFMFRGELERHARSIAQQELMEQILKGETDITLLDVPVVQGVEQEFEDDSISEAEAVPERRKASIQVTGYGIIEIPTIELAMPLVKGTDAGSLNTAAGWYTDSAQIGSAGNAVILGHRMYGYGEHFNRLDEVKNDDEIIITLGDGSYYVYKVNGTETILPEKLMDTLREHNDGYILTLVTCTPTGVGSHRLLVYAELTESYDSSTDTVVLADSTEGELK